MNNPLCPWEPSTFLFFSSNVPALVHYSHFIAILAALVIALYVFASNPKTVIARLFLLLVSVFSIWTILDLILWATNRPDVVMFSWSLQILLEPMTYGVAFYLYYFFLYKKWPDLETNVFIACLFLPIVLLLHTEYNLIELYLSDCEAIEGPVAKYYTHFVHAALILCIAFMATRQIPRLASQKEKLVAMFFGFGLVSFLLAFSSGTIIGSLTDDWILSQYGLFGMPFFAAFIAYCIIKFEAFNVKVITAELLVVALGIGILSLVTLQDIQNVRIVASITFVLVCIIGYILIQNVRREIRLRIHIEAQEYALQVINRQQEGLLAFISHEVKGYLAKSQAAFAGILQGDYGKAPEPLLKMADTGLIDMRRGVDMVTDILEASNLRKGTVNYEKKSFDFRASVEEIVHDLTPMAEKKGLSLALSIADGDYTLVGDEAKIRRHVLRNLVENSIRYTLEGSVQVSLSRDARAIHFSTKDTGVGITKEDMRNLFTEGGHGKDSLKVNVDSTGYGLFIAKQVTQVHKGTIKAFSEGKGTGSEFLVELPLS